MEKYIELLEDWISDDRRLRNNSLESDFDKFCEERNVAIENLIKGYKEKSESEEYLYDAYQDAGKKMFEYSEKLEKLANRIKEKIEEVETVLDLCKSDGKIAKYKIEILQEEIDDLQELLEDK